MLAQAKKRKAIFYQRSELVENERALLEAVIAREDALKELRKLHRKLISESMFEPVRFLRALLALRHSSVRMVAAIVKWRQIYVRGERQIFRYRDGSNYLLRMCEDCGVLSAFHTDAQFGFELSRNNTFCLPTQATKRPLVKLTDEMVQLLHRIAEPDAEIVHEAWLVIRAEIQHSKVSLKPPLSVEDWEVKPWQLQLKKFALAEQQQGTEVASRRMVHTSPIQRRKRPSSNSRLPKIGTRSEFSTVPVPVVNTTIRRGQSFNDDGASSITAPEQHPLMRNLLSQSRNSALNRSFAASSGKLPSTRELRNLYLEAAKAATATTTDATGVENNSTLPWSSSIASDVTW